MGRSKRKREQKQAGEEELGELGELGWGREARAAGSELIASVALLHQGRLPATLTGLKWDLKAGQQGELPSLGRA